MAWGVDQSIVLTAPGTPGINLGSLWRVLAAGGKAELIADPDATKTERGYHAPDVLPDGSILFVIRRADSLAVALLPHGRRPATILIEGAREPHYVAPGYLVFARVATLMAVPFDLQHLAVKGTPVPVLDGVRFGGDGSSAFSLSADGTLVYLSGAVPPRPQRVLMRVDRRTARETALPFKSDAYSAARFSPDGHAVAVDIQGQDGEQTTRALWLGDLTRNTLTPLANDGSRFAWTPDGKHIIFQQSNGGLAWRNRDLSGVPETLAGPEQVSGMFEGEPTWSSDGNTLVFATVRAHANGSDLWMARGLSGSSNKPNFKPDPFLEALANQTGPTFSPDGRWVAYHTDGPGAGLYVRPFPGPGSVAQVGPGQGPLRWIGKELFFVRANEVMAVTITASTSLDIGAPRAVLTLPAGATFADVTPDGQQLLLLKTVSDPAPEPPPHEFRVIINFVEEMKRKVAAGQ